MTGSKLIAVFCISGETTTI